VIQRQVPTGTPIAPSDTVPAMLTPGEFVVNAQDAQKHLPLLRHLNQGGDLDHAPIPSAETTIDPEEAASQSQEKVIAPTPAAPTVSRKQKGIQRKPKGLSIQPAISRMTGTEFNEHSPGAAGLLSHPFSASEQTESEDAVAYSLPSIVHRSPSQTSPPTSSGSSFRSVPEQWNSIEDLLGVQTSFGAAGAGSVSSGNTVAVMEMPTIVHRQISAQGFAEGGEVDAPVTETTTPAETIAAPETASPQKEGGKDADQKKESEMENLAQEIFTRLRQRLEIERERQGLYSGRLPW
jgi:hypothetical protein